MPDHECQFPKYTPWAMGKFWTCDCGQIYKLEYHTYGRDDPDYPYRMYKENPEPIVPDPVNGRYPDDHENPLLAGQIIITEEQAIKAGLYQPTVMQANWRKVNPKEKIGEMMTIDWQWSNGEVWAQ